MFQIFSVSLYVGRISFYGVTYITMAWKKINIQRENGEWVDAQAPEIISASRSTDIPAFYADWFFHRLEIGYSAWRNPFNGANSYVSYKDTRFIVFWSKNPKPLLQHLAKLKSHSPKIECYIQYTLNDYVTEGLEKGVPPLDERIETFKTLVKKLGKGRVIWRFDPLILTDRISQDDLLCKINYIGDRLLGYTEKFVFSFADIGSYRKVKINLERNGINYHEWTETEMVDFARKLSELNKKWGYELTTCGEKPDYKRFGIVPNHCVDDNLMIRFAWKDSILMKVLGVEVKTIDNGLFGSSEIPTNAIMLDTDHYAVKKKDNADKGQRELCGCKISKDIGQYNTCAHLCEYCYANTSKETACRNYRIAKESGLTSEAITSL